MADQILKKWHNFILNIFFNDINDNVGSIKKQLLKVHKQREQDLQIMGDQAFSTTMNSSVRSSFFLNSSGNIGMLNKAVSNLERREESLNSITSRASAPKTAMENYAQSKCQSSFNVSSPAFKTQKSMPDF